MPRKEENQKKLCTRKKNDKNEELILASPNDDMSSDQKNEETATKELQESLLSLAMVICDKMISAGDILENALGLGGNTFVAKLKTIIDENCQPTASSL